MKVPGHTHFYYYYATSEKGWWLQVQIELLGINPLSRYGGMD